MQQPSGSIWHTINCPCWLLQPSSRSSWPPSWLKETAYTMLRSQEGHHCHVGAWDPGSSCDYKSTLAFPGSRRPGPTSSCNTHLGQVQSGEYKLRILSWDNLHSRLQRALRSTQKGAKKKYLTSLVRDSAVEATEEPGRATGSYPEAPGVSARDFLQPC